MPGDQLLAMRAYRQGLAAGDFDLASRAAAVLVRAGTAPPDTDILAFAVALHAGDRKGAEAALDRLGHAQLDFLVPVLRAWLAHDRVEDPMPPLEAARGNGLATRFADRHRALLLIAQGKANRGRFALAAASGAGGDADQRIDAAIALLRAGRARDADPLLADLAGASPAWRKREAKGGRLDATFGAAHLFLGLAGDVRGEELVPLSILLTRAALLLDPEEDRARLLLADALSRSGATDLALATLAEVRSDGPFVRSAAVGRVAALRRAGRNAEALAQAETLAMAEHASTREARDYGELLFHMGRYDDAAAAFGRALDRADPGDRWELSYLRGAALERAGKWDAALPALRRAVELAPDEAEPLTWLGYAQAQRGIDLPGAQALLERAHKLKPDEPEVTDSLGWAYFVDGQIGRALPLLEAAARADPGGARVNEHLGDAYWKLGRRVEARYAWRAAEVTAEPGDAARLQAKIAHGPGK